MNIIFWRLEWKQLLYHYFLAPTNSTKFQQTAPKCLNCFTGKLLKSGKFCEIFGKFQFKQFQQFWQFVLVNIIRIILIMVMTKICQSSPHFAFYICFYVDLTSSLFEVSFLKVAIFRKFKHNSSWISFSKFSWTFMKVFKVILLYRTFIFLGSIFHLLII